MFARTAVQETLQPYPTFCMVLEPKETKNDQDPARMFENDFCLDENVLSSQVSQSF
jgi:hypothetical protein